jgi:hypothetical protein
MNKTNYFIKSQGLWTEALMIIERGDKVRVLMRDSSEQLWPCINYCPTEWTSLTYTEAKTFLKNYDGRSLDAVLKRFKKD